MSIQKITGLALNAAGSNQTAQNKNSSDVVSKRNDTSLLKSDAVKNNMMSLISFKGYTSTYYKTVGTSGSGILVSIKPDDIAHTAAQTVERGNKGYDDQFTGRCSNAKMSVYYADPDEKISQKIKDNHGYIVKYKPMPEEHSEEEILEETNPEKLDNIIQDLRISKLIEEAKLRVDEEKLKAQSEKTEKAKAKSKELEAKSNNYNWQRTQSVYHHYDRAGLINTSIDDAELRLKSLQRGN